jgi:LAO/AO transport system kinase
LEQKGIEEIKKMISDYVQFTRANGFFEKNRTQQNVLWFHDCFEVALRSLLVGDSSFEKNKKKLEKEIIANEITPVQAGRQLSNLVLDSIRRTH